MFISNVDLFVETDTWGNPVQTGGFLDSACMNVFSKQWMKKEQAKISEKELKIY